MHAVCHQCGEWKENRWDACPACGVVPPETGEEAVMSLYLTDSHHGEFTLEEAEQMLREASADLKAGKAVTLIPSRYEEAKAFVEGAANEEPGRVSKFIKKLFGR